MDAEIARRLSGRTVLVVEDEYFIADDITQALERLGATVVGPVATKTAAMQRLEDGSSVDLAILDINLNGQTVYPVADELARREIPFVFATGYDPTTIPDHYRELPRWQKPFDADALARVLAAMDEQSGQTSFRAP
ncbi:response regulator [Jiella pelagia]|uniref:Response regulator n=1 Tax=Jiella pelagia TaxID=2986949 RepID=A0ABY7C364_9HYPH|nr:response regulator [Jiella pelagia]WAP70148.1 response regulator [Jiella pelagia]